MNLKLKVFAFAFILSNFNFCVVFAQEYWAVRMGIGVAAQWTTKSIEIDNPHSYQKPEYSQFVVTINRADQTAQSSGPNGSSFYQIIAASSTIIVLHETFSFGGSFLTIYLKPVAGTGYHPVVISRHVTMYEDASPSQYYGVAVKIEPSAIRADYDHISADVFHGLSENRKFSFSLVELICWVVSIIVFAYFVFRRKARSRLIS